MYIIEINCFKAIDDFGDNRGLNSITSMVLWKVNYDLLNVEIRYVFGNIWQLG